ncbi:GxxExxY protein [Umezakia ovalisporum]|uniref:GxxExxY protein n=1 Tax=Umezakia ovalisporum TaxID=75695 RepID=UPI0028CB664E|nr:GxxExxY protein [Umezakia ovalisporum]
MLESAYEECLHDELLKAGLLVERQKPLPLIYEEVKKEIDYRVDLLVERCVVVEVEAVEGISDAHRAQLITYLKLSGCKLGLLINFHVALLTDGIQRLVYHL